jgi:hypothetical protein
MKPVKSIEPCPNCKETVEECACLRNKCHQCKEPVGNITFTVCDKCWDLKHAAPQEKPEKEQNIYYAIHEAIQVMEHYNTGEDFALVSSLRRLKEIETEMKNKP